MVGDPLHMREHRDDFLDNLTPEEMEVHNRKENQKAYKDALKEMKKAGKKR